MQNAFNCMVSRMKNLALFFAVLLLAAAPAQAAKRVALLVGNSSYSAGVAPLAYPPQDMQVMEAALGKLGFKVRKVLNASQTMMKGAVSDFSQEAAGAEIAFFYYSGHGTQAGGENYLIPVDAAIQKTSDYAAEAISANEVLRQIQGARPGAAILVLDACRDNPYATTRSVTRGLGRMDASTGTIIAFATAPNTTAGDNGNYAKVLARELQKGQKLSDVFLNTAEEVKKLSGGKQEPYIGEMSSVGNIYLARVASAPAANAERQSHEAATALAAAPQDRASQIIAGFESLERSSNGNYVFSLEASAKKIKLGGEVELTFSLGQPAYVYLLYVGSDRQDIRQLWPPNGELRWLDKGNQTKILTIDEPAGPNTFLAIASQVPMDMRKILGAEGSAAATAQTFQALANAGQCLGNTNPKGGATARACDTRNAALKEDTPVVGSGMAGYSARVVTVTGFK